MVLIMPPAVPPAGWFAQASDRVRYRSITAHLTPMLGLLWNAAMREQDRPDIREEICADPTLAWMACSAYAATACHHADLLPARHYLALTQPLGDRLTPTLISNPADIAAGFLTAAARHHFARPVPDFGLPVVGHLLDGLLSAALSGARCRTVPVVAVSVRSRLAGGPAPDYPPWETYDSIGRALLPDGTWGT